MAPIFLLIHIFLLGGSYLVQLDDMSIATRQGRKSRTLADVNCDMLEEQWISTLNCVKGSWVSLLVLKLPS